MVDRKESKRMKQWDSAIRVAVTVQPPSPPKIANFAFDDATNRNTAMPQELQECSFVLKAILPQDLKCVPECRIAPNIRKSPVIHN